MHDIDIKYRGNSIASMSVSGSKTLQTEGKYCDSDIVVEYTKPAAPTPTLEKITKTYTPYTYEQAEKITPSAGYDGIEEVDLTVSAMPIGTAGTPTATKGTVSGHAISVTPSVTNTTGYITGGTKSGTAVSVSASELVSGTKNITASGTVDVTNYASASVSAGSASTPTTTITANPAISVSSSGLITASVSGSKSVTPTVSAGYVSSGTAGTISVSGENTIQLTVKSSSDMTASGATVTAPAGYYTEAASKSVASGSVSVPDTSISVTPSISVNSDGLITSSASKTQSVSPTITAGYVSSGTSGTMTVSGSNTSQLSTISATTYTPNKTSTQTIPAGKYITGDQTIGMIPSQYYDMSAEYSWMGTDAELVSNIYPTTTTLLGNTEFATWTPSTTAKAIMASSSVATYTANMTDYEYVFEWLWDIKAAYKSGATLKAQFYRAFGSFIYCITRRSSNTTNLNTNTGNYNTAISPYSNSYYTRYYNTSGTLAIQFALGQGLYVTQAAPTISDTSSYSPVLTLMSPTVYAKCNSSYFATARASELDQSETTIKLNCKLYRVNRESNFMRGLFRATGYLYNNPL